jgi:hypothetical protein
MGRQAALPREAAEVDDGLAVGLLADRANRPPSGPPVVGIPQLVKPTGLTAPLG